MHKAECVLLHACFWWEKDYQATFRAQLADVSLIIIITREKKKLDPLYLTFIQLMYSSFHLINNQC